MLWTVVPLHFGGGASLILPKRERPTRERYELSTTTPKSHRPRPEAVFCFKALDIAMTPRGKWSLRCAGLSYDSRVKRWYAASLFGTEVSLGKGMSFEQRIPPQTAMGGI